MHLPVEPFAAYVRFLSWATADSERPGPLRAASGAAPDRPQPTPVNEPLTPTRRNPAPAARKEPGTEPYRPYHRRTVGAEGEAA